MQLIDLTKNEATLERSVKLARERNIIIPTLKQQTDPQTIPSAITDRLKNVGLWDLNPLNLFRITWRNEPVTSGGGFGPVNFLEFPSELTGVSARILAPSAAWYRVW
jgi:hypothetical protein